MTPSEKSFQDQVGRRIAFTAQESMRLVTSVSSAVVIRIMDEAAARAEDFIQGLSDEDIKDLWENPSTPNRTE